MAVSHPPVLEMLWEPVDPRRALEERFGFRDADAAGRWIGALLDERWGVRIHSCDRLMISGQNALAWIGTPAGRLIAKWSVQPELFPRLSELARLTRWLDGKGLPVSAPVTALDGRVQVEADGVSIGVQREIEGSLLDTADPAQVRAAGAFLARLQDALAAYPGADLVAAQAGPSRPLKARVTHWLESSAEHLPAAARDTLRGLVADAPADPLPVQLIHCDFRSANILCSGAEVAAVIDFEQAKLEHRVLELARSAVLLGTRFRNWGPVSAEVRAEFLAGYESARALTAAEAGWWDVLVLWESLAMVPAGDDPTGWLPSALSQLAEAATRA